MKKMFLLIVFVLSGVVNQLNSMMTYAEACNHLCVRQGATRKEVEKAFDRMHADYKKRFEKKAAISVLHQAKGFLDGVFIARESAQNKGYYKKEIISCTYLNAFTKQVTFLESNTQGVWRNTMIIDTYDYQRIAIALGLIGIGITSLVCLYRDALDSYFNPKPKPFYAAIVAKFPLFSSKK
jgi:hypothetical protein